MGHVLWIQLLLLVHTTISVASIVKSSQSRITTPTYGAVSGGLAGAGVSSVDPGESYILNPGAIAHLRGATITFGTSDHKSTFKDQANASASSSQKGWHLSMNENSPDSFMASSIFINQSQSRENNAQGGQTSLFFNDAWLTLGNFVSPHLATGLSYHYRDTRNSLQSYQEHNFGIGFLWTPVENLGVGLSFLNFNSPPKNVPIAYTLGSTSGLGLLYIFKDYLRLRFDYTQKNHNLESLSYNQVSLGLETSLSDWLFSRIGVAQQTNETNELVRKYSFGLGFSGPRFGVHYALQQYQQAQQGQEHNLDLVIPF